ncbi:hypothetical protein BALOs_0086 [Halobacteriovorax sp. BALOs_7]|uniref:esterase/lipase family protein n=1 Tax=unclassified Halobacteriovorax TaxID=2639665 RepID=UPI000EA2C4C9|nr:hypothetical protein [Halobacteriovorax sp. BALOs_7]AYF43107.1 hypothetical protein BALOs_0086 [Halobacteriovorax sp. BALOs_7]
MRDTDLFLNKYIESKVLNLKSRFNAYNARKNYSKTFLDSAKELTKSDIRQRFLQAKENLSPNDTLKLMRNLLNSSAWISFSTARYLHSLTNFKSFDNKFDYNFINYRFFNDLKNKKEIDLEDDEIFKIIYNEVEYAKYHPNYISNLEAPTTNATIILIPGVFNELFSTPSFERACLHLKKNYGIKYFTPSINGFDNCNKNAESLKIQINDYMKEHPNEKLWLVAFSKGGLDTLHYLSEYSEEQDSILGLSTIASPILGSDSFNKKLIKTLNLIHNFSDSKLYKLIDSRRDILAKEMQKSLSSTYRRPWLRNNHEKLNPNLFYTSIGFSSKWYDSHLWMMLMKLIIRSKNENDGVVDTESTLFPYYFQKGISLGILEGHHLVGRRSSFYCQEALIEAHIHFLKYKGLLF